MKKEIFVFFIFLVRLPIWAATFLVPQQQTTIQAGIDAATDGDTVLVADGLYTGVGNVNLDFKGKSITVKSVSSAEKCIIDCQKANQTRGVVFQNRETKEAILGGFTIKNGNFKGGNGGGIYCFDASPTIVSCILMENVAEAGAGIFCEDAFAIISNCLIVNNQAKGGGGIQSHHGSPTITGSQITGNNAETGGGLFFTKSSVVVTNTIISDNRADYGGGILCWSDSLLFLHSSTIDGNIATYGGGIFCSNSDSMLVNSILYQNRERVDNTQQQIYFGKSSQPSEADISYCLIQGGKTGVVSDETVTLKWGQGNIDANPMFVDPTTGDYRLQDQSPCIGSGIVDDSMPTVDIEGNDRPFPDESKPDLGAYEHRKGAIVPAPPVEPVLEKDLDILITTDKGQIRLEVYPAAAPITVKNFYNLVQQQFYDSLTFHRYVPGFVIQGGCPLGTGTGGPGWTIPGEFQDPNLLLKMPKHVRGVLAMARAQSPDSAGSQFYICLEDASHLDGNYAAFGRVIEGMKVVDQLRQGDKMETIRLIEKSLTPRRPTKISIQSSVSALPADGESTTKIKLEIFDQDDDGLADQQINIEPDLGRLSLIEDHQNGIYTAVYTAGIQVGQENLVAKTSNGQMATVQIELTEPMVPSTIVVVAADQFLPADGKSTTKVQITVFDQQGKGLAGQEIDVKATIGTLSSLQDRQEGIYTVTYIAGIQVGQENLVAETNNGQMDTVQIELIEPLTPATITVIASELSLPADGKATSQLQVSVLNQRGNGLTEQKITLDATLGQISSLQDQQDGTYIATYTADTEIGQENLVARTSNGITATATIKLTKPVDDSVTRSFEIHVANTLKFVERGDQIDYQITVEGTGGFEDTVFLFSAGVPKGVTAEITSPAVQISIDQPTANAKLGLTVTAEAETRGHAFNLLATGDNTGITHRLPITVMIQESALPLSRLELTVDPVGLTFGQSVEISGKVTPYTSSEQAKDMPIAKQAVIISLVSPSTTTLQRQTETVSGGKFQLNPPFLPDEVGKWHVIARFEGAEQFKASMQESTFQVDPAVSSISWLTSDIARLGETIKIAGQLKLGNAEDISAQEPTLKGQTIELQIFLPESSEMVYFQLKTDAEGNFERQMDIDQVGIWEIAVYWPGNQNYIRTGSQQQLSIVLPVETPTLVGDLNDDAVVDIFDLVRVVGQFGLAGSNLVGDLNQDLQVNIFDLLLVSSYFGHRLTAAPDQVSSFNLTPDQQHRLANAIEQLKMRSRPSTIEEEVLKILATVWRGQLPDRTRLLPNYPNPFNPETWIPFELSRASVVQISIYSINGQTIKRIDLGQLPAGKYLKKTQAAYWNGRSDRGQPVASGVYFCTIQASNEKETVSSDDNVIDTRPLIVSK